MALEDSDAKLTQKVVQMANSICWSRHQAEQNMTSFETNLVDFIIGRICKQCTNSADSDNFDIQPLLLALGCLIHKERFAKSSVLLEEIIQRLPPDRKTDMKNIVFESQVQAVLSHCRKSNFKMAGQFFFEFFQKKMCEYSKPKFMAQVSKLHCIIADKTTEFTDVPFNDFLQNLCKFIIPLIPVQQQEDGKNLVSHSTMTDKCKITSRSCQTLKKNTASKLCGADIIQQVSRYSQTDVINRSQSNPVTPPTSNNAGNKSPFVPVSRLKSFKNNKRGPSEEEMPGQSSRNAGLVLLMNENELFKSPAQSDCRKRKLYTAPHDIDTELADLNKQNKRSGQSSSLRSIGSVRSKSVNSPVSDEPQQSSSESETTEQATTSYISSRSKATKSTPISPSVIANRNQGFAPQTSSKRRRAFTREEMEKIYKGVQKFGVGKWSQIQKHQKLFGRTNVNVKDKWSHMVQTGLVEEFRQLYGNY